jgi:hypothetical protein
MVGARDGSNCEEHYQLTSETHYLPKCSVMCTFILTRQGEIKEYLELRKGVVLTILSKTDDESLRIEIHRFQSFLTQHQYSRTRSSVE